LPLPFCVLWIAATESVLADAGQASQKLDVTS
jgi:hypothetical protein